MAPPLSVQELDWAFAKRTPNKGGWSSKITPLMGRTTPKGTAAIAFSMTGGQDFHPKHPDPRHCTRPARNTHRGWHRRGAIPSCRTGTKPSRRRLRQPKLKSSPPEGRHPVLAEATYPGPRTPEPASSTPARGHRRARASSMTSAPGQHRARVIGARPARQADGSGALRPPAATRAGAGGTRRRPAPRRTSACRGRKPRRLHTPGAAAERPPHRGEAAAVTPRPHHA